MTNDSANSAPKVSDNQKKKGDRDSRGATAVEYAVMLAVIVVVCLSAVTFIGRKASKSFSRIGSAMP